MAAGRLIVLEGPEGVGKSTQLERLARALEQAGLAPVVVREPGGTSTAEAVRGLLLDAGREIGARAEALLFMAARADLVHRVIGPALRRGRTVLADRFFLSTYAYQIGGRGLPEREVRSANALATGELVPDLTLLLVAPAAMRATRAAARGEPDRMERAGDAFHEAVERAFASYLEPAWQEAHPECGPIVAVDGTGTEDAVLERLLGALAARWPETFSPHIESHR
jgi:dTMP kinase